MHPKKKFFIALGLSSFVTVGCQCLAPEDLAKTSAPAEYKDLETYPSQTLPEGIEWQTEDKAPTFASDQAKKGGKYIAAISMFPLTLRVVGPDSSSGPSRAFFLANQMSLLNEHPNNDKLLPALATHWYHAGDGKTVYYKINPAARWTDGRPVTADDFMFLIEFMRSKDIVAPWYNNYYTEVIGEVRKYDTHTISVHLNTAKPDDEVIGSTALSPLPRHFFNGEVPEDFTRRFNWKVVPNTGPYFLSKMRKGKFLLFKRKKDWWAKDFKYNQNRFNVDYVKFKVVRNSEKQFLLFQKGKLATHYFSQPKNWHDKTGGKNYTHGYIRKLEAFNDTSRAPRGFYLNTHHKLLKSKLVRQALSHAINYERVIKEVLRSDVVRLQHAFQGTGEYEAPGLTARAFNPKKVDEYFAEAGWEKRDTTGIRIKGGQRMSFSVAYSHKPYGPHFEILKEEAQKLGIELKLQQVDGTQFFKTISQKEYALIPLAFGSGETPAYRQFFHSEFAGKTDNNNLYNVADKHLDGMIDSYRKSRDSKERRQLSQQIQKYVHEMAVFIPFSYKPYFREAHWRWWRTPEIVGTKAAGSAFSIFAGDGGGRFWFDPEMKKLTERAMRDGTKLSSDRVTDETYKPKGMP